VSGFVSIVGAGPGDPELLTVRAARRLADADLVLYDGLVPDTMLTLAARARHISVARRAGDKTITQAMVTDLMIASAREGSRVVRLKAGDPFVFGRGGEEALALADAGVPFEVVPGLSTAIAAPAIAGIPLTLRGVSSAFTVVTGHAPEAFTPVLTVLPPGSTTVVVLMGVARRAAVADCLIGAGWHISTGAAIVASASHPDERVWTGSLGELSIGPEWIDADSPAVIVIGDVVAFASRAVAKPVVSIAQQEISWLPMTTPRP